MSSLLRTLRESDSGLLPVLAQHWKIPIEGLDNETIINTLNKGMLDAARAETVWDALDDRERGALQLLIAGGAKMQEVKFERVYGAIRRMGKAQIEREKPHLNPASIAESLFYKGLVAHGFENADTGTRTIIYVPDDLAKVLPTRKTSYDNLADEEWVEDAEEGEPDDLEVDGGEIEPLENEDVSNIRAADTSIVDDLTTILAYLQLHTPLLEQGFFNQADFDALAPYLLIPDPARVSFMLNMGAAANLIEVQAGRAHPNRVELRRWLGGTRAEQIKRLAEAWRTSTAYADLFHVPGLYVEPEAGTMNQYNAAVARETVLEMMSHAAPPNAWWSIEAFIDVIREENADFQRPNSDFDSWYIRNEAGDYLSGIESWQAIEGAFLDHLINTPMYWLGLVDLADEAARFTAYGRGFLRLTAFPNPPDPTDKIDVSADGTLTLSRKISRMDRFQVSRFSMWVSGADLTGSPYVYKLDAKGIARANGQGIDIGHIGAFLTKIVNPIPPAIQRLLQNWQGGSVAAVTFERVIIVRTTSVEVMNRIMDMPATRRFLGARLGDTAAIILADQADALRDALGEIGVQVEILGG